LLFVLTTKGPLCFHELVKEAKIDENRVSPNLKVLIEKGFVRKTRNGHKMMYQVLDKDKCDNYLMRQFVSSAQIENNSEPVNQAIDSQSNASPNWRQLHEETDFVVDKKLGIITFSKAPKTTVRIAYRAGYEKTPEPISEATARLAAGFLKWILALKLKKVREAKLISRETWRQVKELIEPFRACNTEKQREMLLKQVAQCPSQVNRLEKTDGLKIRKDYEKLLKWAKELEKVDELKKTRNMTKGAHDFRVGPKYKKYQERE
jgi:hypothetical protein